MNTKVKIFGLLLLAGGGAYVISQLKRISVTLLNIDPPKIDKGALLLAVNVAVDNPTGIPVVLTKPNLAAFVNGKLVGNSIPAVEVTHIKAHDRTVIKGINIQIPFTSMGSLALSLLTGKIPKFGVDVALTTTADGILISTKKHFDL